MTLNERQHYFNKLKKILLFNPFFEREDYWVGFGHQASWAIFIFCSFLFSHIFFNFSGFSMFFVKIPNVTSLIIKLYLVDNKKIYRK